MFLIKFLSLKESKNFFLNLCTWVSIVSNEVITHKENNKGVTKSYELKADSKMEDVSIIGYKIVHKKVLKEKNGWRTLVLIEYKIS